MSNETDTLPNYAIINNHVYNEVIAYIRTTRTMLSTQWYILSAAPRVQQ